MKRISVRRLLLGLLTSFALAGAGLVVPVIPAATPALAQISAEFQEALSPYGHWERHPRWGEVWVPDDTPPDWRPYEYGHWVYTDEWGWYWISDSEEEDWGWIVYHYGRWIHDRGTWFWIPDDEWAPAWVDWRYGDDYVGWAPLPPDTLVDEYDDDPAYWLFVAARFLTAPRLHAYYVPRQRHTSLFRRSHVVNRTLRFNRDRAAVNPGVSPAFVARRTGRALPTYRVSPLVLSSTRGVAGAARVSPQQLHAAGPRGRRPSATRSRAVTVQRTTTAIQPTATSTAPQPLGKSQRGRLGSHPPRAAQGAPALQPQQPTPAAPQPLRQMPPPKSGIRTPPPVTKPPPSAAPHVTQPPPAKSVAPPKPPAVNRAAPVARPTPPTVRRAPPPAVKPVAPPTVKRAAPPVVRHAAPPHAPKVTRPPPHPAPVKKPPPQGKPPAKKPPEKKKPDEPAK